ncbi:MAG TPA: hypothetical protein VF258_05495, partial [Luteolibacter sp.]
LIYRQLHLLDIANATSDTGLAFGYVALVRFGGVLMTGFSFVSIAAIAWLGRFLKPVQLPQR